MQFSDSYFADEVRDGFYVSGLMKRSWAAQLEMLEDIDRICRKYDIQYYAEWGTLLGAVRHSGFIPWDDDMDIGMKRADYNKFLSVASKELPEGYGMLNFHVPYNGSFTWDFLTRIVNSERICFDQEFLEKFHGFPFVVGIDIFPLDRLAPDMEEERERCELAQQVFVTAEEIDDENVSIDEREDRIRKIEEACKVKIDRNGSEKQQLYLLIERLFSLYNESEQEEGELTQMILWILGSKYKLPQSCFQRTVMLPFENTQIPVPIAYDEVLRKKYGEYLEPVHRGGSHEFPFYKRQEDVLQERFGVEPLRYDIGKMCNQARKTRELLKN